MPEQERFGELLRKQRKTKELTLIEVARAAQISSGYLSKLEQGRASSPSESCVSMLAKALDLDAKELARLARKEVRKKHGAVQEPIAPMYLMVEIRMTATIPLLIGSPATHPGEAFREAALGLAQNLAALGKAACLGDHYDEGLRAYRTAEYVYQTYNMQQPLRYLRFVIARTMQNAVQYDKVSGYRATSHLRLSIDYLDEIVRDLETVDELQDVDESTPLEEVYLKPLALFVSGAAHNLLSKHIDKQKHKANIPEIRAELITALIRPRFDDADLITRDYVQRWDEFARSPLRSQFPYVERIRAYGRLLHAMIFREREQLKPAEDQDFSDSIRLLQEAIEIQRAALISRRASETDTVYAEGRSFLARCHKDLALTFQLSRKSTVTSYQGERLVPTQADVLALWNIELTNLIDPSPSTRYVAADDSASTLRELYAEELKDTSSEVYEALEKEIKAINIAKLDYSVNLPVSVKAMLVLT